jgi:hypothetical protein
MARRLSALLGIAIVIGLMLTLMWRVYVHGENGNASADAPSVVRLRVETVAMPAA